MDSVTSNIEYPADIAVIQRVNAINEVIARVWLALGLVWNSPQLVQLAETVLASVPNMLPAIQRNNLATYIHSRNPVEFPPGSDSVEWKGVNIDTASDILINTSYIHEATGLDREGLLRRFSSQWTPDEALNNSIERSSSFDNTLRGDGLTPLLKISPALMHIENISQQSLARSPRGVGVADLRGALEGHNSMSNPALARPASISTLEHTPSTTEGGNLRLTRTCSRSRNQKRPPTRGASEVRDVLNKIGIGAKPNRNLLKASFPTPPKSGSRGA